MMLWSNPDGTLSIMAFAVEPQTPEEIIAARDKVIAKGKRTLSQFHGMVTEAAFPVDKKYSRAWRFSAGAVVVKMGFAADTRWDVLKEESRKKLLATDAAMIKALEEGSANPALVQYRNRLRAIIAVKPAGLDTALNTSALEAIRPTVLDEPIP